MSAITEYEKLVHRFAAESPVTSSQMFGKPCLKVNGKAFVALHKECLVFKLSGASHDKAMSCHGATLWDPSGKGRRMKEWVAIPADAPRVFATLASAAHQYVRGS